MITLKKPNSCRLPSAAIALSLIALFTAGSVPSQAAPKKAPITINSIYTAHPAPTTFTGTFYTHGALEIAGTVTMEVNFISHSAVHCEYTFVPSDGSGTFIIDEECNFTTDPRQGRWEIVGGTGAYENLKGNGSALMPGNQELWEGFIY